MQKIIKINSLNEFLTNLIKDYTVIAPVKERTTKFKAILDPKQIYLDKITKIPLKKFFLPEEELLLAFKENKITEVRPKTKPTIIFGARKCDLNAINVLDKVMKDPNYMHRRKNTILIGMYCTHPDKYCFCESMELINFYDLFFYPYNGHYYISIGSKKGEALVKHLPSAKKEITLKFKNTKKIKNKDIAADYQNTIWETDANKCLSCSACTVVCPTCNCFDIKDKSLINKKQGRRTRSSASCQLKSFSRVAGGKAFRDSRLSRFKHFVYHKIVYFKNRHKIYMCVGCGRCLRACPTHIDWTKTINILSKTKKIQKK
ncbi:hypothetical protein GOV14_05120 [Candidatus Pacearchaeota archaeon]|nr:hypothetical protein [Candidatus Pacearchaeota archaeon]